MTTLTESTAELATARGPMRAHVFAPQGGGRVPGIALFSEIFQVTGPIRRLAAELCGQGYLVVAPEIYHEFEPPGTVLAYDAQGSERGNALKYAKELASYDEDADAVVKHLAAHTQCNGRIASFGVCLGGHLAVRAALHPQVTAAAAFYPTDLHTGTLGAGKRDDTLARLAESKAAFLFVWGRQDPHIPLAGRRVIQARLEEIGARYEWHELNAAHAFLRDEGPRHDPSLARACLGLAARFLAEELRAR